MNKAAIKIGLRQDAPRHANVFGFKETRWCVQLMLFQIWQAESMFKTHAGTVGDMPNRPDHTNVQEVN